MKKLLITSFVALLIGVVLFNMDLNRDVIIANETKTLTIKEYKTFIKQVNDEKEIEGKWFILNYKTLPKVKDKV